jgi:chemotaxis protein methyltransferase WspC
MPISEVIASLQRTMGLDVASVGICTIERAINQRLSAIKLRDIAEYARLLRSSESELQNLIEAVVIPETFFFRHREAFVALRQIVAEISLDGSRKIRLLSVPCATGEEPYSLAMTLLDAGLSPENFRIDAIDISARAIDFARAGVFGRASFRGTDLEFRNRYFQKTQDAFRLIDRVHKCVQFDQGNLLEEKLRFGSEPYDVIFCRNLLIYFDAERQSRAVSNLKRLLGKNGLLFVGPGEPGLLSRHSFFSAKLTTAFAFRTSESVICDTRQKQLKISSPAKSPRPAGKPILRVSRKVVSGTAKEEPNSPPDLDLAGRLADQGQLSEAAAICEQCLRQEGPSSRAFHLLGLIHDCAGDKQRASEFYRRALYIAPDCYEALIHLALLSENSGDLAGAKILKDRARRVLERAKCA